MTTEIRGEDIKTEKDVAVSNSNLVPTVPEISSKKSVHDNNEYEEEDMLNQGRKLRARKKIIRILDEVVDDDIMPEPEEMSRRRRRGGSRRRSRSRSRSRRRRSRRRR